MCTLFFGGGGGGNKTKNPPSPRLRKGKLRINIGIWRLFHDFFFLPFPLLQYIAGISGGYDIANLI